MKTETEQEHKRTLIKYNGTYAYKTIHEFASIDKYNNTFYCNINHILNEVYGDTNQRPDFLVEHEGINLYSVVFHKSLFKCVGNTIIHYETRTHEDFLKILEVIKAKLNPYSIDDEIKKTKLILRLNKPSMFQELKYKDTHIKVGTNLYTNWGYDQTNVELYKIVSIIGKNYFLVLPRTAKEFNQSGYMCGTKKGGDDIVQDIPIKCYISKDGYMSVCESGYKRGLYIEDKEQEHYVSWYA